MKKLIKVLDCILGALLLFATAVSFLIFFAFIADSPDTDYVGKTKYDELILSFSFFVLSIFYCLSLVWFRVIFNKSIEFKNFKYFYVLMFVFIALSSLWLLCDLYDYDILFYAWAITFCFVPFLGIALFLIGVAPSSGDGMLKVKAFFKIKR